MRRLHTRSSGRRTLRGPALAAAVVATSVAATVGAPAAWSAPAAPAAPAVAPAATAPVTPAPGACAAVGLLGVDPRRGEVDQRPGGERGAPEPLGAAAPVAAGVRGARLIAADAAAGILFAVGTDGKLRYWTRSAGAGRYTGGSVVGLGWEGVDQLVAGGNGVFYAVRATGRVLWYRVVDGRWASGSGSATTLDARPYRALASGGPGVLYGVRKDGDRLERLTTPTPAVPTGAWSAPVDTGRTWSDAHILGAGGVLLGVSPTGDVRWYRQTGVTAADPAWAAGSGTRVATGVARDAALAAVDAGCSGYALPLDKPLLSRFAYGRPHHDYPAVDLPVPVGTPVHVIRGGRVDSAGPSGRCGLGVVVLATDGGRYVYCHLSVVAVTAGATVATGSVLGLSGNTGRSTGPHLHVGLSAPTGTARCVQGLLLAVYDGVPVPAPRALAASGCSYGGFSIPGERGDRAPR